MESGINKNPGFTLIELLVVMLIIGVVLSMVVLTINRSDDHVEEEAQRLAALIDLTGQQAILEGKEFAMEFNEKGYRFLALDGEQWQPIEDDEVLRARKLSEGVRFTISMEGEKIALGEDKTQSGARIYLLSSGERSPFRIDLASRDNKTHFHVAGSLMGKLEVAADHAS